MPLFLSRLFGWLAGHRARLVCDPAVWVAGVTELKRRTLHGTRESGAFLLGRDHGQSKEILDFIYYDDIDPHSLDSGIVEFAGNNFPKLWEICRKLGYGVVADVHVHPGHFAQSPSDRANPVIPRAGHLAIIIPDFAGRATNPGGIGIYEYLGNGGWRDHSAAGRKFFDTGR